MTVVRTIVWRPMPGRRAEFERSITTATRIEERLGARIGIWETLPHGGDPTLIAYTAEFDDLIAYRDFSDRLRRDDEWCAFWAAISDPTTAIADRVASALAREVQI